MNDSKIQTLKDVEAASREIEKLLSKPDADFQKVFYSLTDRGERLSPRMFVSLLLVAWGVALPETVLLLSRYPSIEFFRTCPMDEQLRYVRNKEAVDFYVSTEEGDSSEKRTYEQLSKADCRQLFCGQNVAATRKMEKSLRFPGRDYYAPSDPVI